MDKRQTILVVDDIELNRAILCEMFQTKYAILEAADGAEALRLIDEHEQDITVILLDVVMPVMGGIEVLRSLRDNGRIEHIPVILITAENNESTALEGYTIGVSDIINKPFNPEIVIRRVENIIALMGHQRNLELRLKEQYEMLESQSRRIKQTNSFMIDTLSTAVEFRSNESGQHTRSIRHITATLLGALSDRFADYHTTPERISMIADASALHDIGKIAIPDAVLLKPGRLTAEEFEIMKTHTLRGCEMLERLPYDRDEEYYRYCYQICRHHHERWDGRGYPDGLVGSEIPLCAQVVSIADVYDALTTDRVYKKAISHDKAVHMILGGECGCFNPHLLACFESVAEQLREQPPSAADSAAAAIVPRPRTSLPLSERTLRLLELERQKYRVLADLSGDISFDYDARHDVLTLSERYLEVFGDNFRIENAANALRRSSILSEADKPAMWSALASLTPKNSTCRIEFRLRTAAGAVEWFETHIHSIWDDDPAECVTLIGKLTNIHSMKVEAAYLREQAQTDGLTGLLNRRAITEAADRLLVGRHSCSLFFLDVDFFKTVNDSRGHAFGDKVLRRLGAGLRSILRDTDLLARLGGDEFVVLLRDVSQREILVQKAAMVCELLHTIGSELKYERPLSCSLGVAVFPEDGGNFASLLSNADRALYDAKNSGRDRFTFYADIIGGEQV